MDTIKVRVLSRIKREGKFIAAGTEIAIPRGEYDARMVAEKADNMLTHLYIPVEEYRRQQDGAAEAKAKAEGLGNQRHAQLKANAQEANRVAQEAQAIRTAREAAQAVQIAQTAQARSDAARPQRKGRPAVGPAQE